MKQNILLGIVLIACLCKCAPKKDQKEFDLIEYFNSKGRVERFSNANLYFGDYMNSDILTRLLLDTTTKTKYYRKAAFTDTTVHGLVNYFIYGTSTQDAILSQLRIRSIMNNTLIDDKLIFNFSSKTDLKYDYTLFNNKIIFTSTMNNRKSHYSEFTLKDGLIINTSFIPDSVYRRLDLIPSINEKVRILDNFNTRQIESNGLGKTLTGRIHKFYGGGKSCEKFMIIKLDHNEFMSEPYAVVSLQINNESKLYKLQSDSLVLSKSKCLTESYWPVANPVLVKERVYVEYK